MQKGTLFVLISNSSLVCAEYFVVIVDIVFKFNYMMATQCSIMDDAHIMVIVTHKLRFIGATSFVGCLSHRCLSRVTVRRGLLRLRRTNPSSRKLNR